MDGRIISLLKKLGLWRNFVVIMVLRSPFDFLNAVLGANMLESFIRLIEKGEKEKLLQNFWIFLLFTILLFGYNVLVRIDVAIAIKFWGRMTNSVGIAELQEVKESLSLFEMRYTVYMLRP